jgi:hypothetical protein
LSSDARGAFGTTLSGCSIVKWDLVALAVYGTESRRLIINPVGTEGTVAHADANTAHGRGRGIVWRSHPRQATLPIDMIRRVTVFAAAMLLFVAGCTGVPLSTMWKMRGFDAADFAQLDPAAVRAAIQLPEDLAVAADSVQLDVTLGRGEGASHHAIPLREIASGRTVAGLPAAKPGLTWRLLDVAPENLDDFRALQAAMGSRAAAPGDTTSGKGLTISVGCRFEEAPDLADAIPVEIRLQLDESEGLFTLFAGEIDPQP